jgi:hypothetical protein
MGKERPAPDPRGPGELVEDIWANAESTAILPDRDAEHLAPREVRALVTAFDKTCHRAKGRHAAPVSWLSVAARRVATALDIALEVAEEDHDWPTTRHLREDIVDLQAFLPDDEAAAAEAFMAGGDGHVPGDGFAALDRVRTGQAIVISMLRNDELVLGAHVALRDMDQDIRIGEARRSLEAVDRYKSEQSNGFAAAGTWPLGLIVGLVVGTLLTSPSLVAIASVVGLAAVGYFGALAIAFGGWVGTMTSRLDRLAMRSDASRAVSAGRWCAEAIGLGLLFGGPGILGFLIAVAGGQLRLP